MDEFPAFFHEPFTGTDPWILFERTVDLTEPGTYYLIAGSSGADAGKMWISAGRRLAAKLLNLALAAVGMAWLVGCCP